MGISTCLPLGHVRMPVVGACAAQVLRRVWCLFEIFKTVHFKGVQQLRVLAHGVNLMGLKDIFIRLDVGGMLADTCLPCLAVEVY